MKKSVFVLFCLILGILLTVSGCNMPQKTTAEPTAAATEPATETPVPTEIPTPEPKKEKIVFIPSDEVPGITANLTEALKRICTDAYECQTVSGEDEIDAETDFAVFAKEPTALTSLQARFPDTRFILIAPPKTEYSNAWVIEHDEAFLPFLAGLATTSNAYDWRSAGLIPNDSSLWGSHAEEAYLNGAHYFCGNCRPVLAPYVSFPLVISLPSGTDAGTWSAQFDEAQRNFVYTVFLSDEAMSESLLQKLITLNVQMLGVSAPPAGLENNWLATVNFDWASTLQYVIVHSDAGESGGTIPLILAITPGELTEDFSEGKANLLRQAYENLLSGILSPYTPSAVYSEQ